MCDLVLLSFFVEMLGILKHDDWNLEEDRKALQFLKVFGIFILFHLFIFFFGNVLLVLGLL